MLCHELVDWIRMNYELSKGGEGGWLRVPFRPCKPYSRVSQGASGVPCPQAAFQAAMVSSQPIHVEDVIHCWGQPRARIPCRDRPRPSWSWGSKEGPPDSMQTGSNPALAWMRKHVNASAADREANDGPYGVPSRISCACCGCSSCPRTFVRIDLIHALHRWNSVRDLPRPTTKSSIRSVSMIGWGCFHYPQMMLGTEYQRPWVTHEGLKNLDPRTAIPSKLAETTMRKDSKGRMRSPVPQPRRTR